MRLCSRNSPRAIRTKMCSANSGDRSPVSQTEDYQTVLWDARMSIKAVTFLVSYSMVRKRCRLRARPAVARVRCLGYFHRSARPFRTAGHDPGCVKTLAAVILAQQKQPNCGLEEPFMRDRDVERINLASQPPEEWFSHSQDPFRTDGLRDGHHRQATINSLR